MSRRASRLQNGAQVLPLDLRAPSLLWPRPFLSLQTSGLPAPLLVGVFDIGLIIHSDIGGAFLITSFLSFTCLFRRENPV